MFPTVSTRFCLKLNDFNSNGRDIFLKLKIVMQQQQEQYHTYEAYPQSFLYLNK